MDAATRELVRRQAGNRCREAFIVGLTPIGRTTVHVFAMNSRHRLNVRAELIAQGLYP